MISVELLVDLVRRFVLLPGETIEQSREFADGPAVDIETTDRMFSVRVARDRLRAQRAPWVEAVVVARREDLQVEGPPPEHLFLVPRDGTGLYLNHPQVTASLGRRLHRGELDAVAYAEILTQCQWPGGWHKRVVLDPRGWRAGYPAQTPLPPVQAPRTWRGDGQLRLSFFASRENADAVGGRPVLEVTEWSVRARADAAATWQCRPVADPVPLTRHGDRVATGAPSTVGTFRFAATVDDRGADAGVRPAEVTDTKLRERTLAYLRGGAPVYQTNRYGPDHLDPGRRFTVPVGYRTDGEWVWPEAVAYHLERHGVGPEPGLAAQIARYGFRCPPVTAETVAAALDALRGRERIDVPPAGPG